VTCYDLRFPEIFRVLADRGVTMFAVPAAWYAGPLKHEQWETMCRARAIENTSFLAAAGQPPPLFSVTAWSSTRWASSSPILVTPTAWLWPRSPPGVCALCARRCPCSPNAATR